jgi:RimJ/RimL family protein N-acetyltransferase
MSLLQLEIKILSIKNAEELTELLQSSDQEYTKYFIPFKYDLTTISNILKNIIKDEFYGIYFNDVLIGFYMLRGFDAGYEIPSYGVWISKDYSSKGISKFTLQHAISVCKLNNINKIMLKVHPDNLTAKKIYEDFGFVNEGIDNKIGHLIYFKNL